MIATTSSPFRYLRSARADSPRPALFLDRDGVLNRRMIGGYVTHAAELELLDLVLDCAAAAQALGASLVVVTNQGSIGRGLASESDILAVHGRLLDMLGDRGLFLDGIYACPHHPLAIDPANRDCSCRKPKPGLILSAAADLNLDLGASIMIGDQPSDMSAARAAGISEMRAVLVGGESCDDPLELIKRVWGKSA